MIALEPFGGRELLRWKVCKTKGTSVVAPASVSSPPLPPPTLRTPRPPTFWPPPSLQANVNPERRFDSLPTFLSSVSILERSLFSLATFSFWTPSSSSASALMVAPPMRIDEVDRGLDSLRDRAGRRRRGNMRGRGRKRRGKEKGQVEVEGEKES